MIAALLLLLAAVPPSAETLWNRGTLLYDQDKFVDARAVFTQFVKLQPKAAPGWAFLGLCDFETRNYAASAEHIERALRLRLPDGEPLAKVSRYHAALALIKLGEFERAQLLFVQLAAQGAGDRDTVIATGLAGLRMAMLPAELPEARKEFVYDVGHAIRAGSARDIANARAEFEALIAANPRLPELHNLYGQVLIAGDADAALNEWKQELEIAPANLPARLEIAFEYLKRGDAASALPYAMEAGRLEPKSFAVHNAIGRIQLAAGEIPSAILELEKARALAPGSPETRIALASAYAKAGRAADAARERDEFRKLKAERDGSAQ